MSSVRAGLESVCLLCGPENDFWCFLCVFSVCGTPQRGVRTDFTKWIKDCHEKYDMDVMLTMLGTKKPEYNDAEKCTMYDKLTYGHVDYEGLACVSFKSCEDGLILRARE